MKPKVFITRKITYSAIEKLKEFAEVEFNEQDKKLTEQQLISSMIECFGVICLLTDKITERIITSSSTIKIICNYGVGYDNIDIEAANRQQVMVTNTPGVLDDTTADLAFALLTAVSRRIVSGDQYVRNGLWNTGWETDLFLGKDIYGKTLGIIGMGNIGQAMAKRASGFDMKILYHNRNRLSFEIEKKYNATYLPLNELLRESDFISIHVPNRKDTVHLIGRKEIAMMRPDAVFINTARGTVVDEKALYEALKDNLLFGAGLDVFEREPEIYPGLTQLDNVVVLPHIGSASMTTRSKMAMMAVENMISAIQGKMPPNLVQY